jgi:hypothetical protein
MHVGQIRRHREDGRDEPATRHQFAADLERILIHEIYGHAVPVCWPGGARIRSMATTDDRT